MNLLAGAIDTHVHSFPDVVSRKLDDIALVEQARAAGFRDFVAKFDRPGLIAALKELTVEWDQAA